MGLAVTPLREALFAGEERKNKGDEVGGFCDVSWC